MVYCKAKTITGRQCRRNVKRPNTHCTTHQELCNICYLDHQPFNLKSFGCCSLIMCEDCRSKRIEFNFICPGCRTPLTLNKHEFMDYVSIAIPYSSFLVIDETNNIIVVIYKSEISLLFQFIFSEPNYLSYALSCNEYIVSLLKFYASGLSGECIYSNRFVNETQMPYTQMADY